MAARTRAPPSAQIVGKAFVKQYYRMLHRCPEKVHQFYQDISTIGRPEEDGSLSVTTTSDAINAKIQELNYGILMAEIGCVDVQDINGGINILVTGYFTQKDNILQNFTQSFFLAPQDLGGYFVLNDMFCYIDNTNHHERDGSPEKADVESNTKIEDLLKKSYTSSVVTAFVKHYYNLLHKSPWLVHLFYQDINILAPPEEDGSLRALKAKIRLLRYGDLQSEIRSVDTQESLNGGLNVLVTGYLSGKDNILQNFTQSFFLSPRGNGFLILNDMFHH